MSFKMSNFFVQFTLTNISNPKKAAQASYEELIKNIQSDKDWNPEVGVNRPQWLAMLFLCEIMNNHGFYAGSNGNSIVWSDIGRLCNLDKCIELLKPFFNDVFNKNKHAVLTIMSQHKVNTKVQQFKYDSTSRIKYLDEVKTSFKLFKESELDLLFIEET